METTTYLKIKRFKVTSVFSTKDEPVYNELYNIVFICMGCEKELIDSGFKYCPHCGSRIVAKESRFKGGSYDQKLHK